MSSVKQGNDAAATAAVLSGVSMLKAVEGYNKGLLCVHQGRLEEAVLALLESIFYAPQNANPIVALAEVYILLSDLQSAVQQYRRAVWVLTRRDRELRRAEAKAAAAAAREAFLSSQCPQLALYGIPGAASDGRSDLVSQLQRTSPPPQQQRDGHVGISIPNTIAVKPAATAEAQSSAAFSSDDGVQLVAVQVRLAGLLDALALSLFSMSHFAQSLRFCEEALEVLKEVSSALKKKPAPGVREDTTSAPSDGEVSAKEKRSLLERIQEEMEPTLELHRCVLLISLRREEAAELQLESHHERYPQFRVQSSGLLTHLYVNRQAFRSARVVLEEHTSAVIRQERTLIVAQHIFNEKYRQYRDKALKKRDLGRITQCIEVYPADTELLYARARIFIDSGELKRSVKDLFKCIKESNSTHKEAVNAMTEVLIQIGKDSSGHAAGSGNVDDGSDDDDAGGRRSVEEAITYYSESLKWRADNTSVLLARADCYMRIEDYESALQDYRKILQLNPDDPVARQRIAFLHDIWGRKLYSQGKVREAEVEFTNAIKTDDKEALFYYHRALCRFELNESRYGLRDVLSCQQLNPADPKLRAFVIRYLGTDEVPATSSNGNGKQSAMAADRREGLPNVTNSDRQHVPCKRAAALYGQPSARIAKAIRDVHSECLCTANNGGITEDVVARALLPGVAAASAPVAAAAASREASTSEPQRRLGGAHCKPAHAHITYKEFVVQQEEQCGDVHHRRRTAGGLVEQETPRLVAGSKTRLHKRRSNK